VRVHHIEVLRRQERQPQVLNHGQVRQFVLQAEVGQRALRGEEDVRGDVDAVVAAWFQVIDEQAAGPQVPAADLEHRHARRQAVRDEVIELHLADLEPGGMGVAAHRALVAAGRVRFHHRAVVAHVVAALQPERRVASQAAGVRHDALRVARGVTDHKRQS
jgi:hypothetical protein